MAATPFPSDSPITDMGKNKHQEIHLQNRGRERETVDHDRLSQPKPNKPKSIALHGNSWREGRKPYRKFHHNKNEFALEWIL